MGNLTDFMREDGKDIYHAFFPGLSYEDATEQWNSFAKDWVPGFMERLQNHINEQPIPAPGETTFVYPFPAHFVQDIAHSIDVHLAHWNLIQKTFLYNRIAICLYEAGQHMLGIRIAGKAQEAAYADSIIEKAMQSN